MVMLTLAMFHINRNCIFVSHNSWKRMKEERMPSLNIDDIWSKPQMLLTVKMRGVESVGWSRTGLRIRAGIVGRGGSGELSTEFAHLIEFKIQFS